jgi:hypothetical protein
MTNLEKRITEIYYRADGIQELICEGGAEGQYTPKELSEMQAEVYALEGYAKSLESKLNKDT